MLLYAAFRQTTEEHIAGTIMNSFEPSPFNDALEDLRISGSVLLHQTYTPPWRIDIPDEIELQRLLGVGSDVRVLPFHVKSRRGAFDLRHEGRETSA